MEDSQDDFDEMIDRVDSGRSFGVTKSSSSPLTNERYKKSLERQLKGLLIRNPGVSTTKGCEVDARLSGLTVDQLEKLLENIKIELNMIHPNESSKSALTAVGVVTENYLNLRGQLVEPLIHDEEMLAALEDLMPNVYDYVSGPIKIVTRFYKHVTEAIERVQKGEASPYFPPSTEKNIPKEQYLETESEQTKKRKDLPEDDDEGMEERPRKRRKQRNGTGGTVGGGTD
jgi:hypothetical protein